MSLLLLSSAAIATINNVDFLVYIRNYKGYCRNAKESYPI